MIDPMNPDTTTGTTNVPLTPMAADSTTRLDAPAARSRASSGNGHDRIHRFAGSMHRAIDSIEQRLGSAGGGVSSAPSRYGEQARQYGDRLRTRMSDQPLQSAGLVLAAGVLLDRLFLRRPKTVRVVRLPVHAYAPPTAEPLERRTQRWADLAGARTQRWVDTTGARTQRWADAADQRAQHWADTADTRTRSWRDAADARLQRVGRAGQETVNRAGMAAALGLAGTKATLSNLAHDAGALPLQMRMATQRMMARSQAYGSRARATVEQHPWAGLGAVLAASGLLTTALMRRRTATPGTTYAVDDRDSPMAWQRSTYDTQSGLGGTIASRPVTSAVVVLALGMLAGAMLRQRMD